MKRSPVTPWGASHQASLSLKRIIYTVYSLIPAQANKSNTVTVILSEVQGLITFPRSRIKAIEMGTKVSIK